MKFRKFIIGFLAGIFTTILVVFFSLVLLIGPLDTGCSKCQKSQSDLKNYSIALNAYRLDTGNFPDNEVGLSGLVPRYISKEIVDPWGRAYHYHSFTLDQEPYFVLWSFGANETPGGDKEYDKDQMLIYGGI